MPGRMLEVAQDRREKLMRFLEARCNEILLYAYGDCLDAYGGLTTVASQVGFRCVTTPQRQAATETCFVEIHANRGPGMPDSRRVSGPSSRPAAETSRPAVP